MTTPTPSLPQAVLTDAHAALLPCPFCGGTDLELSNTHTPSFRVECHGCEASSHGEYFESPRKRNTRFSYSANPQGEFEAAYADLWPEYRQAADSAIARWNSRQALSRMGGEVVPAGWRDIATAPKDGWLVVAAEGGAIRIESARYVHHHINAAKVDGDSCYFTHWQPLPAAPTAPAQQAARSMECEDCGGAGVVGEAYGGSEFQPPERDRCESCGGSGRWSQQAADVQVEPPKGWKSAVKLAQMYQAEGGAFTEEGSRILADAVLAMAAAQSVPKGGAVSAIADALRMAIRQNSHDMLMTGEEIRQCEQALAASAPTVGALRHQIENAIASTGHSTHAPVDAAELADAIANALATQEPSAAKEKACTNDTQDAAPSAAGHEATTTDAPSIRSGLEPSGAAEPVGYAAKGRLPHLSEPGGWVRVQGERDDLFCDPVYATPPTPPSAPAGAGEGEQS